MSSVNPQVSRYSGCDVPSRVVVSPVTDRTSRTDRMSRTRLARAQNFSLVVLSCRTGRGCAATGRFEAPDFAEWRGFLQLQFGPSTFNRNTQTHVHPALRASCHCGCRGKNIVVHLPPTINNLLTAPVAGKSPVVAFLVIHPPDSAPSPLPAPLSELCQ